MFIKYPAMRTANGRIIGQVKMDGTIQDRIPLA